MIVAILDNSDMKEIAPYKVISIYLNLKAKILGLFLNKTIAYSFKINA